MSVSLLEAWQDWNCPNCLVSERTTPLPPNASRYHRCAGLHMLTAPLIRAGTDCKVTAVERGDYLRGSEQRRGENGKPYMAVVTERADGSNDAVVFAEPAAIRLGGR
jgi:hypothetical protein